jgi:hypothetical protein
LLKGVCSLHAKEPHRQLQISSYEIVSRTGQDALIKEWQVLQTDRQTDRQTKPKHRNIPDVETPITSRSKEIQSNAISKEDHGNSFLRP